MAKIVPVVLSGGNGSRLWPKSRRHFPKQLHCLYGDQTMLQHTVSRVSDLGKPVVVCNEEQRFMVAEQVRELDCEVDILLEPVARNTAPAIVAAALWASRNDAEEIVLAVFPADHMIKDVEAFRASLSLAVDEASKSKLVVFGVSPLSPETGYGYIRCSSSGEVGPVDEFVEKPNQELAQEYVASGQYYWNSGMFVFSVNQLLKEVDKHQPGMVADCQRAIQRGKEDLDFFRLDSDAFALCKNISIDYAVMEKTKDATMVALQSDWSDVGSWQALWEAGDKDEHQNVFYGDVIADSSESCFASSSGRLISLVGVKNLVVVETADTVLVADKACAQNVKKLVEKLEQESRTEYIHHREVHRPWGSYDLVDAGDRYQVKRIEVKPGASLSLQMHHHRAEHWVVVSGTAQIEKGDETFMLTENQSTFIPLGEKHRLSNPGKVPLCLVEVASGTYLAEDDIVRFEDGYGRT